jgi:mono/diheme cytochrome c family protein
MRCISVILIAALGCSKGGEPPPPTSGSPGAQPESAPKVRPPGGNATGDHVMTIFLSTCAPCHGQDGRGNGPAAENITPKPRNYHDGKWQAGVTDDVLKQTIQLGGQKMGKSPMMPGHPEYNDETLTGLVKIIRGFGNQP